MILFCTSGLNYPKTPWKILHEKFKRCQERQKEKNIGGSLKENWVRGFKRVKLHWLNTEVIYEVLPYGTDLPQLLCRSKDKLPPHLQPYLPQTKQNLDILQNMEATRKCNQICARPVISFSFHLPHIFQYRSQPLFSVIIDFMVCIYRLMKRSDKRPLSWLHTMQRLKVFLNDYIDWLYDPFVLPKPHKKAHNVKWNTSLHRCKWLHKMQGKQNQASCT